MASSIDRGGWTPGHRSVRKPAGSKHKDMNALLAVAKSLIGSIQVGTWAFTVNRLAEEDKSNELALPEPGDEILLKMAKVGTPGQTMNLSALTVRELDALQLLLSFAIQEARELAAIKDQHAKEASENGGAIYPRVSRSFGGVFVRQGSRRRDDQGVQD